MSRVTSIVKHDEIVRVDKALRARGASIGRITIFRDRVEVVPNYGDIVEKLGTGIDGAGTDVKPKRKPRL